MSNVVVEPAAVIGGLNCIFRGTFEDCIAYAAYHDRDYSRKLTVMATQEWSRYLAIYAPRPTHIDVETRVRSEHYERRPGWRGAVDFLLKRKPIRVLDDVELLSTSFVQDGWEFRDVSFWP